MLALIVGFLGMMGSQADTVIAPVDSSRVLTVNRVIIIGNKVTKERIISREIKLKPGVDRRVFGNDGQPGRYRYCTCGFIACTHRKPRNNHWQQGHQRANHFAGNKTEAWRYHYAEKTAA